MSRKQLRVGKACVRAKPGRKAMRTLAGRQERMSVRVCRERDTQCVSIGSTAGLQALHALLRYAPHPAVVLLLVCRVQLQERDRGAGPALLSLPQGRRATQTAEALLPTCRAQCLTCAASGFAGLAQLGSVSSDWMDVRMLQQRRAQGRRR